MIIDSISNLKDIIKKIGDGGFTIVDCDDYYVEISDRKSEIKIRLSTYSRIDPTEIAIALCKLLNMDFKDDH